MKTFSTTLALILLAGGGLAPAAQAARSEQEKLTYFTEKNVGYAKDAKEMNLISGIFTVGIGAGLAIWAAADPQWASSRAMGIGLGVGIAGSGVYNLLTDSPIQRQVSILDETAKGTQSASYKVGALETYWKTTADFMKSQRMQLGVSFGILGAGLLVGGAANSPSNTSYVTVGALFMVSGIVSLFIQSEPEKEWDKYQDWLAGKDVKKAAIQIPAPQVFVASIPSGVGGGVRLAF